jgi:hypothetical protein
MLGRTLLLIATLAGCQDEVARKADRAADRVTKADQAEYAEAQKDFEYLRSLRVQSLRAELSVVAIQPLLIQAISTAQAPLLPHARQRLDENLVIFRQRLAQTREAIEELALVQATQWEDRDDDMAQQMAGLFIARDASWRALRGRTDDSYPRS